MSTDNYEKRIRRARKLARQFGMRSTGRYDRRGGNAFWMLGPPRTFEDIEFELLNRAQAERERTVKEETRRITSRELRKKLDQRWANRPIHPIDPPEERRAVGDQPTVTPEDFSKLRKRLDRHLTGRRRPKTVKPLEKDTP